jgi:hypothetical protein
MVAERTSCGAAFRVLESIGKLVELDACHPYRATRFPPMANRIFHRAEKRAGFVRRDSTVGSEAH